MFIKIVKKPGNKQYVYLVEGYRDASGKTKHRRIKSFGRLEELEKDNPDILAELKQWAKEETAKKKRQDLLDVEIDLGEKKRLAKTPRNYGYVFLESLYRVLNIHRFMHTYSQSRKVGHSLDDILRLLVFTRALAPSSKARSLAMKDGFFFPFPDISKDAVYRALDHFASVKDDLTKHMHEQLDQQFGRTCTMVFYDVTNYYFESENFAGLRQKGVSKEKRKTGIVQMGLFLDENGIPITYELFPGNTNDMATMRPIMKTMKEHYGLGKITVVADKGNNTGANLAHIDAQQDHYIVSQRIRYRGNELANIVLAPEGYTVMQDGKFKYKTVKRTRKVGPQEITEHLICFYSKKEADYQKKKRGDLEGIIERFIDNPGLLASSNRFGVKKYIRTEQMDKKTGEIKHTKPVATFDEQKYKRDTELDGYYALVTNDLSLSPFEVIEAYHGLYKIEDAFRVIKSDLQGRPVYVWTDDHIRGHFLVCFVTLTLYRLLQTLLDNEPSVSRLKEALASASAVHLEQDIYLLHDPHRIIYDMMDLWKVDLDYDYLRYEDFKKKLTKILKA